MKKSTVALQVCVLGLALTGNVVGQTIDYEREIRAAQPDAVKIADGVYAAVEGNRQTIHTYGLAGLEFMIEEIRIKLARPMFSVSDPEGYSALLDMYADLTRQRDRANRHSVSKDGEGFSTQAEESGDLCSNVIPYTLEAVATGAGFYSTEAYAEAAFRQRGVGPAVEGDGILDAYSEVSRFGSYTSDQDSIDMPLQGLSGWVDASAHLLSGWGAGACVTAYAAATFTATCDVGHFRSISESYDEWCD